MENSGKILGRENSDHGLNFGLPRNGGGSCLDEGHRCNASPCFSASQYIKFQQVLNPTPLNPTPATCNKRKRKLRCKFWNAALQKLHCNIRFSAVRTSFVPKAALQQTKNCTATSKSLRCKKVALSCRFPAGFKPPRLGTHVSDLLKISDIECIACWPLLSFSFCCAGSHQEGESCTSQTCTLFSAPAVPSAGLSYY